MARYLIVFQAQGEIEGHMLQYDGNVTHAHSQARIYDTINGHTVVPPEGGYAALDEVLAAYQGYTTVRETLVAETEATVEHVLAGAAALVRSFVTLGECQHDGMSIVDEGASYAAWFGNSEVTLEIMSVTELGSEH